jgi:hypothetical protein
VIAEVAYFERDLRAPFVASERTVPVDCRTRVPGYPVSDQQARHGVQYRAGMWRRPPSPDLSMRPRPTQIVAWAAATQMLSLLGPPRTLLPWHFGVVLLRTD